MFFWILTGLWSGGYVALVNFILQRYAHTNVLGIGEKAYWLIPIWLLGVWYIFRLNKKRHAKKIVQQAVADHPFVPAKGFVPHAMPSQGKSSTFMPLTATTPVNTGTPSAPSVDTVPVPTSAAQNNPSSNLEVSAVEEISKLAEEKGLTPFPHVLLQNIMIPLTVSSDVQALLFKFLSVPGSWVVESREQLSDILWKNKEQSLPVLKELFQSREILSTMEPEAQVQMVLVMLDGTIENLADIQENLEKEGCYIVCLKHNENNNLISVSELLDKLFTEPIPPLENEEKTNVTPV